MPDVLVEKGITRVQDVLKLIVSTDKSDAALLYQPSLEVRLRGDSPKGVMQESDAPESTLHRLMKNVQTRAVGTPPSTDKLSDWYTTEILLTTDRLTDGVDIPNRAATSATVMDGIEVQAHPTLKGSVRVVPLEEGTREIGNLALPAVFRNYPELTQSFELAATRGSDGPSVIVIGNIENAETVTPESPLIFRTQATLAQDESLLVVGFDPVEKLYLPLGIGFEDGNQTTIRIDRLPAPTSDTRDVAGSIKMFLRKVIGKKLRMDAVTARLAITAVDERGEVRYDNSPLSLKQRVKAANRILLVLHGIFGDTRGMIVSTQHSVKFPDTMTKLASGYDLILAFDFENINTPIEETAAQLKHSLAEIGLGADHGKTLHILSHSMGSLVTRWFIERDNGSKIVQRAVLVGPPNAGSPWATLQEYAFVGLAAVLNGLTALVSPPAALVTFITLIKGVENIDITLDQMKPDSPFYKVLNTSDTAGVKYTIIAGNTSKIPAPAASVAAEQNILQRLVERLTSAETRNRLLSLAFFGEANDIAVSLKSMWTIPATYQPAPELIEVPCDHVSYFTSDEVLIHIIRSLS